MIIFLIHNKILKYKKKLIQLVTYVNLLRQKGRTGKQDRKIQTHNIRNK